MFSRGPKNVKTNQSVGKAGEDFAATYLKNKGFKIKDRNFRTRWGEIDIVAERGGDYHFVEVKTRSSNKFGAPIESLPFYRVQRLQKMALYYASRFSLMENRLHLSLLGIDCSPATPVATFLEDIVS